MIFVQFLHVIKVLVLQWHVNVTRAIQVNDFAAQLTVSLLFFFLERVMTYLTGVKLVTWRQVNASFDQHVTVTNEFVEEQ